MSDYEQILAALLKQLPPGKVHFRPKELGPTSTIYAAIHDPVNPLIARKLRGQTIILATDWARWLASAPLAPAGKVDRSAHNERNDHDAPTAVLQEAACS